MEADLARFYPAVDYLDRFRRKRNGRRKLTLRRLCVLIRHLPPESSCAGILRDHKPYWTLTDHLLDDLRMVWVGTKKNPAKPHAERPKAKPGGNADPKRAFKLAQAKRRKAKRDAAIAAGDIT